MSMEELKSVLAELSQAQREQQTLMASLTEQLSTKKADINEDSEAAGSAARPETVGRTMTAGPKFKAPEKFADDAHIITSCKWIHISKRLNQSRTLRKFHFF